VWIIDPRRNKWCKNTGFVEFLKLVIFCSKPEEAHPSPQPAVELDAVQGPSPIHKPATGKASEKAERGQHRRSKGKKDVPK